MFGNRVFSRRSVLQAGAVAVGAGVLAACAPTPAPAPATGAAEQATPPPAGGAVPQLIYYYGTRQMFKDTPLVQEEMNKILRPAIGAEIQLNPIEFAAFNDKMQLKNAAGEKYDLVFTSNWTNNYYDNVRNGILLDITDLLPQLAPQYWSQIKPGVWAAAMVKGRLYAAINQQTWTYNFGPRCPKMYADKYGLDWSKINKLEDMEPYWEAVKKGEPADVKPIGCDDRGSGGVWSIYYRADDLGLGIAMYDLEDEDPEFVFVWDFPRWVETMRMVRRWNEAGYYGKEPWPASEFAAKERAGKYASHFHNNKPGIEAEMKAMTGFEWTAKILAKNYLLTNSIIATMTGVNKKTSSAEACMKYFELINTDKVLYNLLCYGIEGKHWVWVDKEKEVIGWPEGLTAENHPYNPNTDWQFGNQFNAYYTDPSKVGAWEATRKLNEEAPPSPVIGFSFDREPVKTELAQVKAVTDEYITMGIGFLDFDKVLPEYRDRILSAGGDKILAEVNRQLQEWKASR
jgi:putative aldouronate transport system substrate-binding protein